MTTVNEMRLGQVGYIGVGALHHLSLWQKNCVRNHTEVSSDDTGGNVKIKKVEGGWNAVVPEGMWLTVMGAPDPGRDWYAPGEVFLVSSID
ncbi:MAG: hypothetical protein RI947_1384 [Candidatus Parcubacteria bacterium]|jgi:hypothetical protein